MIVHNYIKICCIICFILFELANTVNFWQNYRGIANSFLVFYNINNNDVIQWSKKLNRLGVESYVYVNTGAGHGGFDSNDTELLAYFLNYFLEQIEK